ncbi:MAG: hypothetical protein DWC05_07120, partial [Candidatus Poseidoniales archaeon]
MVQREIKAIMLMSIMFLAPLSGCFGEAEQVELGADALLVESEGGLLGGMWQQLSLTASEDLAVYMPYFIQDPGSLRAQNGTVLDLKAGESVGVNILFPPRNANVVFFLGEHGREHWPIRMPGESWSDWLENPVQDGAVQAVENEDQGGLWPWLVAGNKTGGEVIAKTMETVRPQRSDLTEADGVGASDGWVNGRDVYDWVDFITDDTPCATCGPDGAVGYLDRWIGNANPSYEHAITYFEGVMKGYDLDSVEVHRFQSNTAWAVNICGYKTGSVYPDEWLIFG